MPEEENDCTYTYNNVFCNAPKPLPSKDPEVHLDDDCPEETAETHVNVIALNMETKIDYSPTAKFTKQGCVWYDHVGIPSTPPAIGCAPHSTGFGQFEGGVAKWTLSLLSGLDAEVLKRCRTDLTVYGQTDWDSILNLNSHPEWQSNLTVRRERNEQNMTVPEFINLAAKMMAMQDLILGYKGVKKVDSSNIGIGITLLPKTDEADPDTYGLTSTVDGEAVGSPLPLVAEVDATGVVTGLTFPVPNG